MNKKSLRANAIDWAIVLTVVGIVVSIITLATATLDARYNASSLEGDEISMKFTENTKQYSTATLEPCKGVLKWGWNQKSGKTGNVINYNMKVRKVGASSWTNVVTVYFSTNNKYIGPMTLFSVNGYTDYQAKITRTKGTTKTSKLVVDYFVD